MGMLVLSRRRDEQIRIKTPTGAEIWLTAIDIRGDRMRVGITAPRDHQILRAELIPLIEKPPEAA